jgi:hypothetical protein
LLRLLGRGGLILRGLGGGGLRRLLRLRSLRESPSARSQENASQTGRADMFQQEGHQISFPMIGHSKPPSRRPRGDGT